jgi:hypothetical protein
MSDYPFAELPEMEAFAAQGFQPLAPEAAQAMRVEQNGVIPKPSLENALSKLKRVAQL